MTAVLLVWINAAVGLIGNEPVKLLYFGILFIGFIGALLVKFQPRGMSYTLFAMAIAQALVPLIAWMIGEANFTPGVFRVFALHAFFAVLFAGSGMMFQKTTKT